ncbi:hypothetical protein SAMN05192549_11853 [Duganella sacchari]|uniref:F5/8 type C domain-containing protein n=1 Tax=Duganella sacchari TaxID=551987 RepID=A0A1M7RBU2_9BURK|nr:hypothetical protein [Duganella sacchari]SHN43754.1 hypothetical protein SAMN05192549_11853 [Duganella sacchari]
MKYTATVAAMMLAALLSACHKKEKTEEPPAAATPAPAPAAAPAAPAPAPAADPTPEQQELAKKKSLLEYGVMEDKYLNDPRGQWATDAKASSVFGDDNGRKPSESNLPVRATGAADDHSWTNNNIDKGFDWLELSYAKPVNATEVRVVLPGGKGAEAINKVELQDTDGKWNTVWEGMSEVKRDQRGSRTWFVRTFDKTAYKVKGVKITLANNLQREYKEVDAVQLVGDQ